MVKMKEAKGTKGGMDKEAKKEMKIEKKEQTSPAKKKK